nr:MAG TPA: transcriptional regulator [Caudoviricetes sp.]
MDCPVIRECAAEAIETDDIGVIRAGVPIPDARRVDRRNATRALHAIAGGYDIRGVLWDKGVTMRGYHRG